MLLREKYRQGSCCICILCPASLQGASHNVHKRLTSTSTMVTLLANYVILWLHAAMFMHDIDLVLVDKGHAAMSMHDMNLGGA